MSKNNKKVAKKVSKAPAAKKAAKAKPAPAKKAAAAKKPVAKKAPAKAAKKPAPKKAAPVKASAPKKKVPAKAAAPAKLDKKAAKKPEVAAKSTLKAKTPQPQEQKAKAPKKEEPTKKSKAVEEEAPEEFDEELDAAGTDGELVEEVILTDAEGRRYCRVRDCDQLSSVDGYCRYHYLLFWKRIQVRKKILTEGKLERYVEDLTGRYPDKFLEMLRKDLRSEKEFLAAIQELEIDEGNEDGDFEDEDQNFIDEVRGMSEGASDRGDEDY